MNQPEESFPEPTSWADVQHVKCFLFLFHFGIRLAIVIPHSRFINAVMIAIIN